MQQALMVEPEDALEPGTPVEVRSRFDGGWKRGFLVDTIVASGYLLKRLSDGSVLPVAFAPEELRPAAAISTTRR